MSDTSSVVSAMSDEEDFMPRDLTPAEMAAVEQRLLSGSYLPSKGGRGIFISKIPVINANTK
jgi:hypothetical protein